MRYLHVALWLLLFPIPSAEAQVSVGVSIGIDVPAYPRLVAVPGYPVYYAPRLAANYFFFDGLYWVYAGDAWYASSWYNGPWSLVAPDEVPVYLLRVPVRYYRVPPPYFHGWRPDAPPRWGDHWGDDWRRRHDGWDRWNRRHTPRPAPLPTYQRRYDRSHYPMPEQRPTLHGQYYRYQPRDATVRRTYETQGLRVAPERRHEVPRATPPAHRGESAPPRQPDRQPGRDRGHR